MPSFRSTLTLSLTTSDVGQFGNQGAGTVGQGPGAGVGGNQGIPPTGALNNEGQQRGGGGHSMTGKVEHAVGSMIGSNALKAKGLQKEQ